VPQYHPEQLLAGTGESPAPPEASVGAGSKPVRPAPGPNPLPASVPTSFVNGRALVRRFLGDGGKKRVFLAHDAPLDRDDPALRRKDVLTA